VRAVIVPNGGSLSVSADANWTMGGQHQNDSPPPLILGGAYGPFSISASALTGASSATVTLQTQRASDSLLLTMSGRESSGGGQTATAQITWRFIEIFSLTAPATVQLTDVHNTDPHFSYGEFLRDVSDNHVITFDASGMANLPTGQYRLESLDMSTFVSNFGTGTMSHSVTLAIIPEPATLAIAMTPTTILLIRRRRRISR